MLATAVADMHEGCKVNGKRVPLLWADLSGGR